MNTDDTVMLSVIIFVFLWLTVRRWSRLIFKILGVAFSVWLVCKLSRWLDRR